MKQVLVTGSAGFVGRVLTDVLEREGFQVWGIDQHPDSTEPQRERNITIDLKNRSEVVSILDKIGPRFIVHLAAQSSAGQSFADPHFTIVNNLLPVLHILDYLRTNDADVRLLVVGSAEVYGPVAKQDLPLKETHEANPASPYALSKWLQEECCRQYASLYDIDVVMTRSFNHTGPGQRDTFVLPSFAKQIVEIKEGLREPRVRVGNIDMRRDFSDVKDVCKAYTLLLREGKRGRIYNVCSGVSHSLRDLLEALASMAHVDIEIDVDAERTRSVDIDELCGDNRRIASDTGWTTKTPIEETLRSLLDYWSESIARLGH
ncbi:MAG: GDP-mannose 4,6-dehydratase [Candidatus Krumholzibacteria bacterium]|nr:GDP-mannose 4,6-dehydratase [Candidatus Krumholzibacteria bacterium]